MALARDTPVSACVDRLSIEPLIARADDSVLAVVRRSAAQPQTRLVGVVDAGGRLIGVTPILRLAESIVARVAPDALLADITDLEGVARFGHEVAARSVGDVMQEPAAIPPSATIDDALRLMHRRRLSGLYVVDNEGRPTGYLDLLELVILYADAFELGEERRTGRAGESGSGAT
jgi:CBS domain-containing protein